MCDKILYRFECQKCTRGPWTCCCKGGEFGQDYPYLYEVCCKPLPLASQDIPGFQQNMWLAFCESQIRNWNPEAIPLPDNFKLVKLSGPHVHGYSDLQSAFRRNEVSCAL